MWGTLFQPKTDVRFFKWKFAWEVLANGKLRDESFKVIFLRCLKHLSQKKISKKKEEKSM